MKGHARRLGTLVALGVALVLTGAFGQGELTPPSGPPAPTQKSLQEIWDKLGDVEKTVDDLRTEVAVLEAAGAQNRFFLGIMFQDQLPWVITTVDDTPSAGFEHSLAIAPDGHPAIAYRHGFTPGARYAKFNGATWDLTLVSSSIIGIDPSLDFGPDGFPAIAHSDADSEGVDLIFSRFDGQNWEHTHIHNQSLMASQRGSLAFGPDGFPAIAFNDVDEQALKYARFDGTSWATTTVDATSNGFEPSLAFGPDDQPAIAFFDGDDDKLSYARFDGAVWIITTIDAAVGSSGDLDLLFGPDGSPLVSYHAGGLDDLRFARFDGNQWVKTTVIADGEVGRQNSMGLGPDGLPIISFYDNTNQSLRIARKVLPAP